MRDLIPQMVDMNFLAVSVLLLFFTVFLLSIYWAVKMKASDVDYMSNLPLDPSNTKHNEEINHG